jgi:hypothetical protein
VGSPYPGQKLRAIRELLKLSFRDVEGATARIAQKYGNEDYAINLSRLSDIETKGVLPNIYRLYSLSVIYRRDIRELLKLYGIEPGNAIEDISVSEISVTHSFTLSGADLVSIPVRMDPGFNSKQTTNIGRFVETWGPVPFAYVEKLAKQNYTYGFIGLDDLMMHPLLKPGSLVQVDESKNKIAKEGWRSEYERPIYFLETREKFFCCWCRVDGEEIIAETHPLSPERARILRRPQVDVLGQVVGVAMRLSNEHAAEKLPRQQR